MSNSPTFSTGASFLSLLLPSTLPPLLALFLTQSLILLFLAVVTGVVWAAWNWVEGECVRMEGEGERLRAWRRERGVVIGNEKEGRNGSASEDEGEGGGDEAEEEDDGDDDDDDVAIEDEEGQEDENEGKQEEEYEEYVGSSDEDLPRGSR